MTINEDGRKDIGLGDGSGAGETSLGMPARVATLILAGGAGVRIGGAKPLRCLDERPLLGWALEVARSKGGALAIAVRDDDWETLVPELERVRDLEGVHGPLAALGAGLPWARARGADFLLTLPCDTPFLPEDLCVRLQAAAARAQKKVALPQSGGRLHPTCGLWRTDIRLRHEEFAEGGRSSLIGLASRIGFAAATWCAIPFDPFFNINVESDLARAEALLAAMRSPAAFSRPFPHGAVHG